MRNPTTVSGTPKCEVADVVSIFEKPFVEQYGMTAAQRRILEDIRYCRTQGMGGHAHQCDGCRHIEIAYNSCRNRHCPKCGALNKARWLRERQADLLPVPYLHMVFTLPHELNDLISHHKTVLLNALFRAVQDTLTVFARDPKHDLAGQLGYTAILHTWDQKLNRHIHLHCIVPAGVYRKDDPCWIPAKTKFLFPVKALSRVFKGKYVSRVRKTYRMGKLGFYGKTEPLPTEAAFSALLSTIMKKDWVVTAKHPFKSPKIVLDYLGRYTHRVAIANHRLKAIAGGQVSFVYQKRDFKGKIYRSETRICRLAGEQFLKRFLFHEIPLGFMRIRHYGFMGNHGRKTKLKKIRSIIAAGQPPEKPKKKPSTAQLVIELMGVDITRCPKCGHGRLKKIDEFDGIYQTYRYRCRDRPRQAG